MKRSWSTCVNRKTPQILVRELLAVLHHRRHGQNKRHADAKYAKPAK